MPQDTAGTGSRGGLGAGTRALLLLAGVLFAAVPFLVDERLPGDLWAAVFGGLFLFAALFGRDPFVTRRPQRGASFWSLPDDLVPEAQPLTFGVTFGLLGGLYAAYYDSWRHAFFGFAAGLLIGACGPLFRYRIGAFLVITVATTGFLLGTGWDQEMGRGMSLFLGTCLGFAYAALFWGDRTFGLFWSGR